MILNVAFLVRFSFFRFLLLLLLCVYAFAFLLNERSALTVWCSTALCAIVSRANRNTFPISKSGRSS